MPSFSKSNSHCDKIYIITNTLYLSFQMVHNKNYSLQNIMEGDSGRLKIPLNKLNYKKKKKRLSCVHDNAKAEKPMECV